jgi:hypothetical protein
MIVKTNSGYVVKSEKGKTLSRTYPTRKGAEKRLSQIHYFQNKSGK